MPSQDSSSDSIRIFISYARDDDEQFVKRLWHYLETQGSSVWWDRQAMESRGHTFLREIRDAIGSANRVLLIVGPRAKDRPYVEVEWRHALREGVVVTPLLRLGDYNDVPKALRSLHTEDVRESVPEQQALEQVRRIVATRVPALGPLVAVPRLPTPYLERSDRLDELRSRVLIDAYEPIDLEPDQRITSITGMGGVGKSVLAAALAQLPEVRRSFADGVHWIVVGRGADTLRTLTHIGIAIGDDSTQSYTGVPEARLLLGKKLAPMNCLIVLDDVWEVDVAEALHTAAGKNVRILLTGRKRKLFASAGVHEVPVDELTTDEALNLLAAWAGIPREELPPEAKAIADECGNLPLALAMVGATIRRQSDRWSYSLARLKSADLSKIKRDLPDYAYHTLDRAMLVSFEELDEDLQRRYLDFVAIPEDVAAPAIMIRKWWTHEGMNPLDVTEVLDDLVDRSLLRVDEQDRYSLHDVQRDFLVMRTPDGLHERWLTAFAAQNSNGWASAEDDGYVFDHLDHHLRSAGREAEWRSLLLSFSWLQRKITLRGFPAALLDLAEYPTDESIARLYRVCRRTAHILTNDSAQLAAQLLARLEPTAELQPLLEEARGRRDEVWLRPITRSLSEEGEPTLAVFRGRETDGHAGTPRSIALSSDGRLIASGGGSSNDLTVKIWSTEAAKLLRTYENAVLAGGSTAVAFIGDDGRLAAAGPRDVRLYTLDAEEPVARHTFDDSDVTSLCTDPSSGTAIIGFRNGRVLSWDPTRNAALLLRALDDRPVVALACASASPRLVVALEGIIECRDTKNGTLIGRIDHDWNSDGIPFQLGTVFISQDGSRVVFGNPPVSWLVGSEAMAVMEQIRAQVVGLSNDGTIMLTTPDASELTAIQTETGREIRHIRNSRQFSCVGLNKDGRAAATGDFEHDVKLWDLTEAAEEKPEWQLRGPVWNLAISDDTHFAIFASETGYELWDTSSGTAVKDEESIASVHIVRRGRSIPDPQMKALRAKFEKVLGVKHDDVYRMQDPVGILAVSVTGNRAISAVARRTKGSDSEEVPYPGGDEGYPAMLWNLKKIRTPVLLRGHMRDISCADITSDGKWALTGSRGRILRLWDLDNHNCVKILRGHRGIVFGCALTDDARFAISGSEDMTVRLWDLERGKLLFTFAASSAVSTCDISRDGSVALAAEVSGRVHTFALDALAKNRG